LKKDDEKMKNRWKKSKCSLWNWLERRDSSEFGENRVSGFNFDGLYFDGLHFPSVFLPGRWM